MTEGFVKKRVDQLLRGSSPPEGDPDPADVAAAVPPDPALQVLVLAQRTADDHVAAANRDAETTRTDARVAAYQITKKAQDHADRVLAEADTILVQARTAADLTARDAQLAASEIRRQAEGVLSEAHFQAEKLVGAGREMAERLKVQGEQKYEDTVGGLSTKRVALQQQIEKLEAFDNDYRQRLTAFLHTQLRALWAQNPQARPPSNLALPALSAPVRPDGPS